MVLSCGLHLIAFVGLIVVLRTASSDAPIRPRRSITFVTFTPQVPRMVMPAAEDLRSSPAPAQQPSREEPAVARMLESQLLPHGTPGVEAPKPIDLVEIEHVSAELVASSLLPTVPATAESRASASGAPAVGLFDVRLAADRHLTERPSASVQLAGFGEAAPRREVRADRAADQIRSGGFDLRSSPLPSPTPAPAVVPHDQIDLPVEITFKPSPDYTEEARALKVEGVVSLEVVFCASGEIRVLRVLDGLGHGLDETAAGAARRIRFRPARSGGVAVDLRTTLRITFRVT
jgi:TonB family protein